MIYGQVCGGIDARQLWLFDPGPALCPKCKRESLARHNGGPYLICVFDELFRPCDKGLKKSQSAG